MYVDFKEIFGGNRGDLQSIDKTGAVLRRLIQEVGKRPKPKFIRPKESTGLESKWSEAEDINWRIQKTQVYFVSMLNQNDIGWPNSSWRKVNYSDR